MSTPIEDRSSFVYSNVTIYEAYDDIVSVLDSNVLVLFPDTNVIVDAEIVFEEYKTDKPVVMQWQLEPIPFGVSDLDYTQVTNITFGFQTDRLANIDIHVSSNVTFRHNIKLHNSDDESIFETQGVFVRPGNNRIHVTGDDVEIPATLIIDHIHANIHDTYIALYENGEPKVVTVTVDQLP